MEKSFVYQGVRFSDIKSACKEHKVRYSSVRSYQTKQQVPIQEALDWKLGRTDYVKNRLALYKIALQARWHNLGTTQQAANARGGWVCVQ